MKLVKYNDNEEEKFVWLHPFEGKWEIMISPIFNNTKDADEWMDNFKIRNAANINTGNYVNYTK